MSKTGKRKQKLLNKANNHGPKSAVANNTESLPGIQVIELSNEQQLKTIDANHMAKTPSEEHDGRSEIEVSIPLNDGTVREQINTASISDQTTSFYIRKLPSTANQTILLPLCNDDTLKENLIGRTILEYPSIYTFTDMSVITTLGYEVESGGSDVSIEIR